MNTIKVNWKLCLIVLISTILAIVYAYSCPYILYNDSDPLTYFRKAWWYIGHAGGSDIPSRGPGYPFWLILTGAASLDVWWGLILSQYIMAILAPLIVYCILMPLSCQAALIASVLFLFFGISYQYSSWVMTEELFLFIELLSFMMISWYFSGYWNKIFYLSSMCPESKQKLIYYLIKFLKSLYPITFSLAFLTLIKPAGSLFFWVFICVAILFKQERLKNFYKPIILYISIMMTWGVHHYLYSSDRFPTMGEYQTQDQRHFADLYYGNGYYAINGWKENINQVDSNKPLSIALLPATINRQDGPFSEMLYQLVALQIIDNKKNGKWNAPDSESLYQLYGQYSDEKILVDTIFLRPNSYYYSLIQQAASGVGGDSFLYKINREHYYNGFWGFIRYFLNHPTMILRGPSNAYVGYHFFSKYYRQQHFYNQGFFGPRDIFLHRQSQNIKFIDENNGKSSYEFAQSIRFFMTVFPHSIGLGDEELNEFGGLGNMSKAIIDQYDTKYRGSVMGWVFWWLSTIYGEERMGNLLGSVAYETTLKNPYSINLLFGDFISSIFWTGSHKFDFLFDPFDFTKFRISLINAFQETKVSRKNIIIDIVNSAKKTQLPESLGNWVGHIKPISNISENIQGVFGLQYDLYKYLKPLLFSLSCILMFPLIIRGYGNKLVVFLFISYVLSAIAWVVGMIMPGSDPRHEEVYSFIPILIISLGISFLRNSYSNK